MLRARPPWLVQLLVALGVALGVLWPVWCAPLSTIPGHPLGDGPKHVWSYWHVLQSGTTWPWTDALNAPTGGVLLDPMALPAMLLAPVTATLGPAAAANLWVVAMLVLTGLGAARLARELGASEHGAVLAAGLAPLAPSLLAYPVVSGVHERLSVALLPWLGAELVRRARTGQGAWWTAVLLAPLALHSGVWAWVGALMVGASLLLPRRVALGRFVPPLVVGTVLMAGAFLVSRGWSSDPMSLAPQPGRHGLLGPGGAVVRAATLSSLFWPSTPGFMEEGDLLVRGELLGAITAGLAVWGLTRDRSRMAIWWAVGLGLLIAWSLGPWPLGRLNPVYAVSVWMVPLLGAWPEPGQLTMVASPLLTAWAVVGWSRVDHTPLRGGLVILLVLERLIGMPELTHRTKLAVDPAFAALVEPGPVATLPRDRPGRRLTPGTPFLAQLTHEQPIAPSVFPGVSLWDSWAPLQHGEADDWAAAARCLQRGGLRYVAIERALVDDPDTVVRGLQVDRSVNVAADTTDWTILDLGPPPAEVPSMPPFQPLGAAPPAKGWLPPAPLPVGTHTVERSSATCPVDQLKRRGPPASG